MRAVVVEEFGDPGVLRVADVPLPEPGPGQIRVSVAAAGINPVDTYNVKDPSWAGLSTRLCPGLRHRGDRGCRR